MNNLCTDTSYSRLNKYGEQLCGDHIEIVTQDEDSLIMVLADGLGSGVKASILSTLTSKIISTMMAHSMSIEDCVSTIASTLPVCEKRGIAYSTFTIVRVVNNSEAEIIQYDNPHVIMLRNGKNYDYEKTILAVGDKQIYRSKLKLHLNDLFILMSDGAVYAGVGRKLNYGWQRENIISFMEKLYKSSYTAKIFASLLTDECYRLYEGRPGDDTSVGIIQIRKKQPVNLMIGPPADPQDVSRMMALFFAEDGKHIVCGGTTSKLAAEYLKKELITKIEYMDREIPPTAKIEGVDLVTEGVVTMNRVLRNAQNYIINNLDDDWSYKKDGASLISILLFEESTDINFYVGKAINPAHQNPDLPVNLNIKMLIVDELVQCLKKMGKRTNVHYF
ncbi:MAG: SpoIIE family protein phosphatase [Dethiobacter sp.]|nr:SpoIIE family protein phosphatase [Dethiobacter sp.]MCL5981948.1 SpoIIE family protein phosphatase [Bacillota bacterium]